MALYLLSPVVLWRCASQLLNAAGVAKKIGSVTLSFAMVGYSFLLRRAFSSEILECLKCGGRRELIALINPGKAATRILKHVGIPSVPPQLRAARGPPDVWWD